MGEPPARWGRLEDVRDGDAEQSGEISATGGRSRGHDDTQSGELLGQADAGDGPGRFAAPGAGRLPSATVTPNPPGRTPSRPGVTRPLAFFVGRGGRRIGMYESLASSAGVGSRTTLVRIQPSRLQTEGQADWRRHPARTRTSDEP